MMQKAGLPPVSVAQIALQSPTMSPTDVTKVVATLPAANQAVVQKAVDRGTGARALRSIIEEVFLEIMYALPEKRNVASCTITKDVITKKKEPLYSYEERKQSA